MSGSIIGGHNIQFGVVGGNVTILLGSLDYRVEFVTPSSAETPQPPLSDQPSYLLDPRHQVVPYRPRAAEEARLRDWLEDRGKRVSVLMLTGPAGQGKTRLASHVASVLHQEGWAIAQAVPRGAHRVDGGDVNANALNGDQPLLVVVDYAERWRLNVLVRLVESVPRDFKSRRVRVLMLSRQGELVWGTIAAELAQIEVDRRQKQQQPTGIDLAKPIMLGEFTTERAEAFAEAVAAFTRQMAKPDRPRPSPPPNLFDAAYASPLILHMAALAAVYGITTGDSVPGDRDPQALSRYLLQHERRYWNATSTAPMGTSTASAIVIEEVVWWATLFGPVLGHGAATGLLQHVGLADGPAEAGRLLEVHERLYPAARDKLTGDDSGHQFKVATLSPLQPDRLGEDFVGNYLATYPHPIEKIVSLIGAEDNAPDEAKTLDLRRCMIVLAAAASRHQAATKTICTLLGRWPALAAHGGATVVQFVADHAPSDLADTVSTALPMHEAELGPALPKYDADLLGPAADLTHRAVNELPADAPPGLRADRILHLGNRLAHLGRCDEASTAISKAVGIYRRLANGNPAYQPYLAVAMSSLCNVTILKSMTRHVLLADEEISRVRLWPDGLALTTSLYRHFVAGPESNDWLIAQEEWVNDVVIAVRDDIIIHGQPERYGFLLLTGGGEVYLNDPTVLAELGRRLYDGMNPVAYAQLLVQFHRYTSAMCALLTKPGELRRRFECDDLPDNDPIRLQQTPKGLVLTFHSSIQYERSRSRLAYGPWLDLMAWTVWVPARGPAEWESWLVAEGVPLHRRDERAARTRRIVPTETGDPQTSGRSSAIRIPAPPKPEPKPMETSFLVTEVWDLPSRDGLLVSGKTLTGKVATGMTLQDDSGHKTRVLALEFLSPRDIATGEVTIMLERTDPSPAQPQALLTATFPTD